MDMKYKKYLSILLGICAIILFIVFSQISAMNKTEKLSLIILSVCFLGLGIISTILGIVFGIKMIKESKTLGILGLILNLGISFLLIVVILVSASNILKYMF